MEIDKIDRIVMSKPADLLEVPPSDSAGEAINAFLDQVWAKKLDLLRVVHREDQLLAEAVSLSDSFISVDDLINSVW